MFSIISGTAEPLARCRVEKILQAAAVRSAARGSVGPRRVIVPKPMRSAGLGASSATEVRRFNSQTLSALFVQEPQFGQKAYPIGQKGYPITKIKVIDLFALCVYPTSINVTILLRSTGGMPTYMAGVAICSGRLTSYPKIDKWISQLLTSSLGDLPALAEC